MFNAEHKPLFSIYVIDAYFPVISPGLCKMSF